MTKIKCQCGHENPFGTILCEQCGRPLSEEAKQSKIVDMRYEGAARRSQTYNKSIIDKVWNFFSSVKVGVWLIVIVLATSAIGTILPQELFTGQGTPEGVAQYYERNYGTFGKVYHALGFHDMYGSWWFKTLVGMLGMSILIASIDRVFPLYKSLKKQRTKRHPSFMKRQRVFGENTVENPDQSLEQAAKQLESLKYKVKVEDGAILAEKGRFSRWGPYVNHAGLLIFLFGILMRGIPGFYVDESMWIREGETREIPGAPGYLLENKRFALENYSKEDSEVFGEALDRVGTIAKNYQTDVILYKEKEGELPGSSNLEVDQEFSIIVNKPLKFDGYSVFQMDFRLDELKSMTFQLVEKATNKSFGEFKIELDNPNKIYELNDGSSVKLLEYVADYDGLKEGELASKSPVPNNPAFVFEMITPNSELAERSLVRIQSTVEADENKHAVKFVGAETRHMSGLTVRKDKTLYLLLFGGIVFMIGVAQGSYWNHRRVWIQKGNQNELILAGHTNKNWLSLKKDIDKVKETVELPPYEDREDKDQLAEKEQQLRDE